MDSCTPHSTLPGRNPSCRPNQPSLLCLFVLFVAVHSADAEVRRDQTLPTTYHLPSAISHRPTAHHRPLSCGAALKTLISAGVLTAGSILWLNTAGHFWPTGSGRNARPTVNLRNHRVFGGRRAACLPKPWRRQVGAAVERNRRRRRAALQSLTEGLEGAALSAPYSHQHRPSQVRRGGSRSSAIRSGRPGGRRGRRPSPSRRPMALSVLPFLCCLLFRNSGKSPGA